MLLSQFKCLIGKELITHKIIRLSGLFSPLYILIEKALLGRKEEENRQKNEMTLENLMM